MGLNETPVRGEIHIGFLEEEMPENQVLSMQ